MATLYRGPDDPSGLEGQINQARSYLSQIRLLAEQADHELDLLATRLRPLEVIRPEIVRPNYEDHGGWTVDPEGRHRLDHSRLEYLVIHHSGGSGHNDHDAAAINRYHRQDRKWAGIGYHFWIRWSGLIQEGRPMNAQGAHAGPLYNPRSWGVCVAGNYEIGEPTPEAWRALVHLCAWLQTQAPRRLEIAGHGELAGIATSCPGRNLNLNLLRREVEEYLRR